MFSKIRKALRIKTKADIARQKELGYRMKLAKAHREAEIIRKNMIKQRNQAIEFERNGEHEKAVTLALQAEKKQKVFANAEMQLQKCANIHDLAMTQKSMTAILGTCKDLSNGIVKFADMEGAMEIQAENEEAFARLIDTGDQMEMFAEGIGDEVMPEVRNAAGEAALAAIMAEQEQPEQSKPALSTIKPDESEMMDIIEADSWIKSRRENLQALASE